MSRPREVLVVGAGWAAEHHVKALRDNGDRVAAIVDPDSDRRRRLAGEDSPLEADDLSDLLAAHDDFDCAIVASPSAEHLGHATALVANGTQVLVEKPHRLPGQEPDELLDALRAGATRAEVAMTTRYSTGLEAVRSAISRGDLGEVQSVSDAIRYQVTRDTLSPWYFTRAHSGGGVLITNGVHCLDRVAWLLGQRLELRWAALHDIAGRGVEDLAELELWSSGGAKVHLSLLWASCEVPQGKLRVLGTAGSADVEVDGSWHIAGHRGVQSGRDGGMAERFERQWRGFVRGGPDRTPSVEELETTLELIESAYSQAEVNR